LSRICCINIKLKLRCGKTKKKGGGVFSETVFIIYRFYSFFKGTLLVEVEKKKKSLNLHL
jgi:hypothetical protein